MSQSANRLFAEQLNAELLRNRAMDEARLYYDLGHNHGKVVALVRTARFHHHEARRLARRISECSNG